MQTKLFYAALMLAWLLTPESLILVDRSAGLMGMQALAGLGAGLVLALLSGRVIHDPGLVGAGYGGDIGALAAFLGKRPAAAFTLAVRVPLLLLLSTALLATAGFAFNEIFVYWFPNFLFASLMLIFIVTMNLGDRKYGLAAQGIGTLITVTALMILIVLGVAHGGGSGTEAGAGNANSPSIFSLGLLSFLGFDFYRGVRNGTFYILLVCGFALLSLWVMVALNNVEAGRLAASEVAYMYVARAVAGDSGRHIMGVVLLGGVFCGVNGLFIATRNMAADFSAAGVIGKISVRRRWLCVLMCGAVIEAMMLGGVAGEASLAILLRAALVLWLCHIGLRTFAAAALLSSLQQPGSVAGYVSGAAIMMGMLLIATNRESFLVLVFVLSALALAFFLVLFWKMIERRINPIP